MFRFDEGLTVYLHRDPVDVRMGINGLSTPVEQAMHLNPMVSALFVFGSRSLECRDRITGYVRQAIEFVTAKFDFRNHRVERQIRWRASRHLAKATEPECAAGSAVFVMAGMTFVLPGKGS